MTELTGPKRVLANPADELRAQRVADREQLPLQLTDLVPAGDAYILDPARLFEPRPQLRSVGICSRCATDVVLTPGRGANCACGSMQIPESFFERKVKPSWP